MFTVTEAAGAHLTDVLSEAPEQAAVRFTVDQKALKPQLDTPREDDVAFQHEGRIVLLMEPQLAEALSDRTLDTQDTEEGTRLVLRADGSDGESPN